MIKKLIKIGNDFKENYFTKPTKVNVNRFKFKYMNVVILCGGYELDKRRNSIKPKPMVEIGDKPILHHIMKLYSNFSIKDLILL